MDLKEVIAENIARLRTKRGLSQRAMAEELGIHGAQLSQLESGRKGFSLEMIEKLSVFFGVSPAALLTPNTNDMSADKVFEFITLLRQASPETRQAIEMVCGIDFSKPGRLDGLEAVLTAYGARQGQLQSQSKPRRNGRED